MKDMHEYKELLYSQFGILGKALSSPKRLEILDLLCQGEHTVDDLAKLSGLSISNVSQHLRVLREARLVDSRKDGLYVHYFIADPSVAQFWQAFRNLAVHRLAEVREVVRLYFQEGDELEPVGHEELERRIEDKRVVILDVRPEVEYNAAHLPGAHSIPLDQLKDRLGELPQDKEIIAYCRGPLCVMAVEAVKLLRSAGYQARRTEESIPEWQHQGLPTETANHSNGHKA